MLSLVLERGLSKKRSALKHCLTAGSHGFLNLMKQNIIGNVCWFIIRITKPKSKTDFSSNLNYDGKTVNGFLGLVSNAERISTTKPRYWNLEAKRLYKQNAYHISYIQNNMELLKDMPELNLIRCLFMYQPALLIYRWLTHCPLEYVAVISKV